MKAAKREMQKEKPVLEEYDASGMVLGRFASIIAKKLINGTKINIYNAEKAVVTGSQKVLLEKYRARFNYRAKGNPEKGPKYFKVPHLMLKQTITKMLPTTARGVKASKNLKVYIGNDENKKLLVAEKSKLKQGLKYLELSNLCKKLGAKW